MEITKCNHCNHTINVEYVHSRIIQGKNVVGDKWTLEYEITYFICPLCGQPTMFLSAFSLPDFGTPSVKSVKKPKTYVGKQFRNLMLYPKFDIGKDYKDYVPEKYIKDYNEIVEVLSVSPKACAVLCRRLCEILLREVAGCQSYRLESKIDDFIRDKKPTSPLVEFLPYLKLAGDTIAHNKQDITGVVIEVEKDDCIILIEAIELLFDFLFVQPKIMQEKLQKLQKFDDSKNIKN